MSINRGKPNISVSAVITRANGTTENLGIVGYQNNNLLKMIWWKIKRFIKLLKGI